MSTVEELFGIITRPNNHDPTVCIDDAKLKLVAQRSDQSLEKVVTVIARRLLFNFSLADQKNLMIHSPQLKECYLRYLQFYDLIVQALLQGKEAENLPQMQRFLQQFSAYECVSREEVINKEVSRAFYAHDVIRSFPERFKARFKMLEGVEFKINPALLAAKMFQAIDGTGTKNSKEMGPFFYKYIALVTEGKFLTWVDLATEWAKKGGDGEKLQKFIETLSFNWMRPVFTIAIQKERPGHFKTFTIEKTLPAFERTFGIVLSDALGTLLRKQMDEEDCRRDLVYYMGFTEELIRARPVCCPAAYPWLLAARRYLRLQSEYEIDASNKSQVFVWIFHAIDFPHAWDEFSSLKPLDKKKLDPREISWMLSLQNHFGEGMFNQNIFFIFLASLRWRVEDRENFFIKFCRDGDLSFYQFYPNDLVTLFSNEATRVDLELRSKQLAVFLRGCGCREKSPKFFDVLSYPWNEGHLTEMRKLVGQVPEQPPSTATVLEMLIKSIPK